MVRIIRTSTPNQTLILIEPVSRLEISAKDIRTRIQQLPPSGATPTVISPIEIYRSLVSIRAILIRI